jgi:hypothetical protein
MRPDHEPRRSIPPEEDAIRIESPKQGAFSTIPQPIKERSTIIVSETSTNQNGHARTNGEAKANGQARGTAWTIG